jgi:hypothetical protein
MSDIKKGEKHPNFRKPRYEGAGSPSQAIEVTDFELNKTTTYISTSAAASACFILFYFI